MQHPFAGVIAPAQKPDNQAVEPASLKTSRRGLFGLIAGALAVGTFGVLGTSSSAEAQFTTLALNEEGGRRPTTRALGEEGGRRPTTRMFGEEGGRRPTVFAGEDGRRRRLKK
jgi:hypothetical protein